VEEEQHLAMNEFDNNANNQGTALVVKTMSKNFGNFKAVRGLSFTVKQGRMSECKANLSTYLIY